MSEKAVEEKKNFSKLSVRRLIKSLGLVSERYGSDVPTIIGTILRLWCKSTMPGIHNAPLPFSKKLAEMAELCAFVAMLKQMTLLEGIYWLSTAYAILINVDRRKQLAMFFTPVSLAEGLLKNLEDRGVDFGTKTFMDPACGGAAFLVPIALRMRQVLKKRGFTDIRLLKHIEKHLLGSELDLTLCELSKYFLCMALNEQIQKAGYVPSFLVHSVDSLTHLDQLFDSIDVVVCNPPYRKIPTDELEWLRPRYPEVIQAQPNLYALFMNQCVRLLRIGGQAALITPTSFLSGQYYGRLRKYLYKRTEIEEISIVTDKQGVFIDVEQETALTILRKSNEVARLPVKTNVSVVTATGRYKKVGNCSLPNDGSVWPVPRSIEDVYLIEKVTRSYFRLSDYGYRVRIGSYVWNRDKRPKFRTFSDARRFKAHTAMPLMWARDIGSGKVVRLERQTTYEDEYRFVDLGNKKHTSVVTSPCVVMQRVTSNDQSRRLVAATVSSEVFKTYGGFIGENHVVILEAMSDKPILTPKKLVKLLSARAIDRYFRCISGATNVSAYELRQLALPNPLLLKKATSNGKSMEEAVKLAFGLVSED